ncbi:hypothetical protein FOL47_006854 [Perkinsus chesapeaki]|uniref:Glycogenin n=1 Tax=Perkinsus chesapeaki TaxID=330153 RepID=A0A7J6LPF3_PERCH|nr:hypothetical protein FOL47_006854 [Perkinsus chesapeaki]
MSVPEVCMATLVMGSPSYIAGALVMAYSVRKHCGTGTVPFHTVCIVDRAMPGLEALHLAFDRVVPVDRIRAEPLGKRWKRYGAHYDDWIDSCLTKLHVFNLHELGYHKVVLVDADVLVVNDRFTEVLSAPAPSGICSDEANKLGGRPTHFRALKTGDKVPSASLKSALVTSYGMRGCLMVLPTGAEHFQQCIDQVALESSDKEGYVGKCGDPKCNAGPDEWLISLQFRNEWRHLDESFCCRHWQAEESGIEPISIHFVTDKPWDAACKDQWPDFDIWLNYARDCLCDLRKSDDKSQSKLRALQDAIEVCEKRKPRLAPKLRDTRPKEARGVRKPATRNAEVEDWFKRRAAESSAHSVNNKDDGGSYSAKRRNRRRKSCSKS